MAPGGVCVFGLRRARLRDRLDAPPDPSSRTHDRRGQHGHRRVHGRAGTRRALGGRIASRLSRRQALWTYALLELVVALAALSIAGSLTLLAPVFAWAYGEDGAGLSFRPSESRARSRVLLVPGVALGATFPMAVRVAVTSPTRPGGAAGRLYGANTAGAAIGSLAAGFVLIPILGLTGTTLTGMAASAGSIALALSIVRRDLTDAGLRTRQPSRASSGRMPGTIARSRKPVAPRQTSMVGTPSDAIRTCSGSVGAYRLRDVRARGGVDARAGDGRWPVDLCLRRHADVLHHGSCAGLLRGCRLSPSAVRRPAVALALTLIATAAAACVSVALVGGSLLEIGPGASGRYGHVSPASRCPIWRSRSA